MTGMASLDHRQKQRIRPGSSSNKNLPATHLGRLHSHKEEQSPSTLLEGKMNKSATRPLSISFIDDDLDEDMLLNKVEIPSENFAKKELSDISGLMRFTPFHRNVESPNIEDSAF